MRAQVIQYSPTRLGCPGELQAATIRLVLDNAAGIRGSMYMAGVAHCVQGRTVAMAISNLALQVLFMGVQLDIATAQPSTEHRHCPLDDAIEMHLHHRSSNGLHVPHKIAFRFSLN